MQFLYIPFIHSFKNKWFLTKWDQKSGQFIPNPFPEIGRIRLPFDVTGRPRSLRNPTDANPSHTVTCDTRGTQPWMLNPAWFMQLVFFYQPQASEIFKIFSWLHFGGLRVVFIFWWWGMCFFLEKNGVCWWRSLGELAQCWWKKSYTKSFTR